MCSDKIWFSISFCNTLFINSLQSVPVVGHDRELGTLLSIFPIATLGKRSLMHRKFRF